MWTDISRGVAIAFFGYLTLVLAAGLDTPLAAQECGSELVPKTPAVIFGLEISDTDLIVTIAWEADVDPAPATLELHDRLGAVAASKAVQPQPGAVTTEVLPAALAALDVHGLAYTVEISGGLAEPSPFHVELVRSSQGCGLEMRDFHSDPVLLDPELGAVLTTLADQGSQDLLADALALDPGLECKIVSFAKQLDYLSPGIPTGSCSCPWTGWVIRNPELPDTFWPQGQPRELGGTDGRGAAHYLGAQTLDGLVEATVGGETRLAVDLRCWKFSAWTTQAFSMSLFGGPKTPVRSPVLMGCEQQCSGQVMHEVNFASSLDALATNLVAGSALATASERVSYAVDDQEVFTSEAAVRAEALPGASQTDAACVDQANTWLRPETTEAVLEAYGGVSVEADGSHGTDTHAFAELGNGFTLKATGYASCAVQPAALLEVRSYFFLMIPASSGGINLQPW